MKSKFKYRTACGVLLLSFVAFSPGGKWQVDDEPVDPVREAALDFETTSGIASGAATPDGRPLLWKSRDRGVAQDMEYHYVDDGRIPFISMTDRNEDDEYYGGINAAGFAIENTDAHNIDDDNPASNGWGFGLDDGETMNLALATCRTVDDYETILDSLNEDGRTYNYNYGVIDAFGGAAIFETWAFHYERFDVVDAEEGFLIRSNYAYSGPDPGTNDRRYGINRHNRSMEVFKRGVEENILTPQYILRNAARNLRLLDLDPYPLPFDGYYRGNPYGTVPNTTSPCRSTTRVLMVAQGVADGERPDDGMLWAVGGNPLGGVATPLWVRAGSVPEEYDGEFSSRLCDRFIELRSWVYVPGEQGLVVDTWRLHKPDGTGLWDHNLRLESWVFFKTNAFLRSPNFSYDRLEAFQNSIARQVADSMDAWKPSHPVADLTEPILRGGSVELAWGELRRDAFGRDASPTGYAIYASDEPFRENNPGELLAVTRATRYVDESAGNGRYYRVEARY